MGLKTIRFTYPKFARRSQVLQVFLAAIVLYSHLLLPGSNVGNVVPLYRELCSWRKASYKIMPALMARLRLRICEFIIGMV